MELGLEVLELLDLALHHLGHGHARPGAHDLGDLLARDLLLEHAALRLLGVECSLGLVIAPLQVRDGREAQLGGAGEVTGARGALLLGLGVVNLALEVLHLVDGALLVLPLGLHAVELLARGGDLLAKGLEALLARGVLLLHEGLLLDLHLRELAVHRVDVGGHAVELHAQAARRLVHEVDGLVGQEAVRDVAVGEVGG